MRLLSGAIVSAKVPEKRLQCERGLNETQKQFLPVFTRLYMLEFMEFVDNCQNKSNLLYPIC